MRQIHVKARMYRLRAFGAASPGDLAIACPVADYETLETHLAVQRVGQQPLVALNLDPVPARKARHHGQRAGVDRGGIALRMLGDQLFLADLRIALILALERTAVGKEMLGGRRDMRRDRKSTRLNSSH